MTEGRMNLAEMYMQLVYGELLGNKSPRILELAAVAESYFDADTLRGEIAVIRECPAKRKLILEPSDEKLINTLDCIRTRTLGILSSKDKENQLRKLRDETEFLGYDSNKLAFNLALDLVDGGKRIGSVVEENQGIIGVTFGNNSSAVQIFTEYSRNAYARELAGTYVARGYYELEEIIDLTQDRLPKTKMDELLAGPGGELYRESVNEILGRDTRSFPSISMTADGKTFQIKLPQFPNLPNGKNGKGGIGGIK